MDVEEAVVSAELFLNSSSDYDNDEEVMDLLFAEEEVPKVKNYITEVVHRYNDERFQKFFRLTRETAYRLIDRFADSRHCPKSSNAVEKHILLFLRFAADKMPIRSAGELFDVSESTANTIVVRVIDFLNDIAADVIVFPSTAEEMQEKANEFLDIANIDGIVGCIDGSYISIRTPAHKVTSVYANRHDETALTLQAICDKNCRFLDCFTGVSGRTHDARIYEMSFIRDKINLMGREFHILGDGAYPLSVNLLTPYRYQGNFTEQQRNYNLQFSRCRVKIENAFGNLKNKFHQLMHLEMATVEKMSRFIIACWVLYNLSLDNDVDEEYMNYEEIHVRPDEYDQADRRERQLGVLKRDEIASLL